MPDRFGLRSANVIFVNLSLAKAAISVDAKSSARSSGGAISRLGGHAKDRT
jgi:hypothetical protein